MYCYYLCTSGNFLEPVVKFFMLSLRNELLFFSPERVKEPMLQIVSHVVPFFEVHFQTETPFILSSAASDGGYIR